MHRLDSNDLRIIQDSLIRYCPPSDKERQTVETVRKIDEILKDKQKTNGAYQL